MIKLPLNTTYPFEQTYSEIIDVRSEKEYAEDHLPNAINLPVLHTDERVSIGTIYKQISPFEAKKQGSSLIAKNISHHLQHHFLTQNKYYFPLVYCWRGGQRSQSLALVLSQIGWRTTILEGGYKTYRTYVQQQLQTLPQNFTYYLLLGLTGSGKTDLLHQLEKQGCQVLDLEALANHKGSVLGQSNLLEKQPSQKKFESQLLEKIQQFNPNKPVWLESESNQIGNLYLPKTLWQQMKTAKAIEIHLTLEKRIEKLLQDYSHFIKYPELLRQKLIHLKPYQGKTKIQHWNQLIKEQNWQDLVKDILTFHYDPAYERSLKKVYSSFDFSLDLADFSEQSIQMAIAQLKDLI